MVDCKYCGHEVAMTEDNTAVRWCSFDNDEVHLEVECDECNEHTVIISYNLQTEKLDDIDYNKYA